MLKSSRQRRSFPPYKGGDVQASCKAALFAVKKSGTTFKRRLFEERSLFFVSSTFCGRRAASYKQRNTVLNLRFALVTYFYVRSLRSNPHSPCLACFSEPVLDRYASHYCVALWQPSVIYAKVNSVRFSSRFVYCSHLQGVMDFKKVKIYFKINQRAQAGFPCASATQFVAQASSPEVNAARET